MPKPNIAKLVQSPRDKAVIVTLNTSEVAIVTGVMGGCCSVVLLWGQYHDQTGYQNVRGQHAGGGPGNLDWDQLLKDVPPGGGTQLVMSCAPDDYGNYILKIRSAMSEVSFNCKRNFQKYTNAYIGRDGSVREYDWPKENANFLHIRNMNVSPII